MGLLRGLLLGSLLRGILAVLIIVYVVIFLVRGGECSASPFACRVYTRRINIKTDQSSFHVLGKASVCELQSTGFRV